MQRYVDHAQFSRHRGQPPGPPKWSEIEGPASFPHPGSPESALLANPDMLYDVGTNRIVFQEQGHLSPQPEPDHRGQAMGGRGLSTQVVLPTLALQGAADLLTEAPLVQAARVMAAIPDTPPRSEKNTSNALLPSVSPQDQDQDQDRDSKSPSMSFLTSPPATAKVMPEAAKASRSGAFKTLSPSGMDVYNSLLGSSPGEKSLNVVRTPNGKPTLPSPASLPMSSMLEVNQNISAAQRLTEGFHKELRIKQALQRPPDRPNVGGYRDGMMGARATSEVEEGLNRLSQRGLQETLHAAHRAVRQEHIGAAFHDWEDVDALLPPPKNGPDGAGVDVGTELLGNWMRYKLG